MSLVTVSISADSRPMPAEYELLSLEVTHQVNRIPWARLSILDGNPAKQSFAISDGDFFEPGSTINIKLRQEGVPDSEASVFQGLVVRHAVEARSNGCLLTVEMKHSALKMSRGRHSRVHSDKTDQQIIESLIRSNSLSTGKIDASDTTHKELPQYYCSDWDFMLARAEANGMLLACQDNHISARKISLAGKAKHRYEFGISEIHEFEMEIDAQQQYADIKSIAWDAKTQTLTQASVADHFSLLQTGLDPAKMARKIGPEVQTLADVVPQEPGSVKAWANAAMVNSRMGMLRGRLAIPGNAKLALLDLIEIAGVGQRFKGTTLITGVSHVVDEHGWRSNIAIGLPSPRTREDVMAAPAGGQLPGAGGLQIGVVTNFDDPDKLARIRVKLPLMDEKNGEVWARLASPDAGNGRGMMFRPEPGDEVVVGFFNNDPRQAVILGAMFSAKNLPPAALEAENNHHKGFLTRSGITMRFVDEDKKAAVLIETPGKNKIVLDDAKKTVQLSDQHGNVISLTEAGIEIISAKKLVLNASGGDLELQASANVIIKGSAVDIQ